MNGRAPALTTAPAGVPRVVISLVLGGVIVAIGLRLRSHPSCGRLQGAGPIALPFAGAASPDLTILPVIIAALALAGAI